MVWGCYDKPTSPNRRGNVEKLQKKPFSYCFFQKWFCISAPLEDRVHKEIFKTIPYPRATTLPRFGGATANLPLRIDGGTSQDTLFPILLALLAYLADPWCLQAQKNCRAHPLRRKRLWPWHELSTTKADRLHYRGAPVNWRCKPLGLGAKLRTLPSNFF